MDSPCSTRVYLLEQGLLRKRLLKERGLLHLYTVRRQQIARVSGHEKRTKSGMTFEDLSHELSPAFSRHNDIRYEQIDFFFTIAHDVECMVRIHCFDHLVTGIL